TIKSLGYARPMHLHVIVERDDAAGHENLLRQMEVIRHVERRVAGVDREQLDARFAEQRAHLGGRKAQRIALDDPEMVPLRRDEIVEMRLEHRQRTGARMVDIELLVVEHIDREALFAVDAQRVEEQQKQPAMNADRAELAVYA